MTVLVILLAHGLIKLPIYLWKFSDNNYNLINALSNADRVRKEYRSSLIEYHEQISICKSLESQHANGYNRHFFDILLSEIPENDLEGQKIRVLKSIGGLEVKKGHNVDEHLIAQVRYKHKLAFFQYMRKRSRWQELFSQVDRIVQKPVNFDKKQIQRQTSNLNLTETHEDEFDSSKLTLKPAIMDKKWNVLYKVLACFMVAWALIVLTTETTLVFDPEMNLLNYLMNH